MLFQWVFSLQACVVLSSLRSAEAPLKPRYEENRRPATTGVSTASSKQLCFPILNLGDRSKVVEMISEVRCCSEIQSVQKWALTAKFRSGISACIVARRRHLHVINYLCVLEIAGDTCWSLESQLPTGRAFEVRSSESHSETTRARLGTNNDSPTPHQVRGTAKGQIFHGSLIDEFFVPTASQKAVVRARNRSLHRVFHATSVIRRTPFRIEQARRTAKFK